MSRPKNKIQSTQFGTEFGGRIVSLGGGFPPQEKEKMAVMKTGRRSGAGGRAKCNNVM